MATGSITFESYDRIHYRKCGQFIDILKETNTWIYHITDLLKGPSIRTFGVPNIRTNDGPYLELSNNQYLHHQLEN